MGFIGQTSIINDFKNKIINKEVGHAYALTGPAGMGKRTLAQYIARMLLCQNNDNNIPCGICRSCKGIDAGGIPTLNITRRETQKILIKQIRGIVDDIGVSPAEGKKVYIIEEAERMTIDAQNCLLKTLEEPPPYAVIILITSYYESLLTTIRSRTVQVKLKSYKTDEIRRIIEKKGVDIRGKDHILTWCQGNPGKAIELLNDRSFSENREKVFQFVFKEGTFSDIDFNLFLSKKKDSFLSCLDIMESIYRDALFVLYNQDDGLINLDKKDNIVAYAQEQSPIQLINKINDIQEMKSNFKRNMNFQLAVDISTLYV